jgi:hypothetical protein
MTAMPRRAVLAIASEPQQQLLAVALEAHGVATGTVSPSAHLETEVMRAMRAGEDPPLIVLDLAVLAQLRSPLSGFCAWKDANCASGRLVLYCSAVHAVRPEERAWARRHGARDLLCGCSAQHWRQTVVPVLRVLLGALDSAGPDEAQLARAMPARPGPQHNGGVIARAWATRAALQARGVRDDEFMARMRAAGGPEVRDRMYQLQTYQECFVGTAATDWIAAETGLARAQAVQIGQALLDLGHIYHVVREQPFVDGHYFYRHAADSPRLAAVELGALLQRMRSSNGVAIRDRTYHAITFPSCFVGAEAVAWLMRKSGLSHNEAMTLGQRLIDLFIIHHVSDEHPFRDGYFFYRFYEDERTGGI